MDSPGLVLLHGLWLSGSMWQPQIELLSDEYHCLAPDLPEHGRSTDIGPLTLDTTGQLQQPFCSARVCSELRSGRLHGGSRSGAHQPPRGLAEPSANAARKGPARQVGGDRVRQVGQAAGLFGFQSDQIEDLDDGSRLHSDHAAAPAFCRHSGLPLRDTTDGLGVPSAPA